MSISDRLDQIAARCNAATDGPWESDRHVRGDGHVVIGGGLRRAHLPGDVPGHAENAEFIAHARADVPWLVEQVRKRDAALRAVLELHVSQFDRTVDHDGEPGTYCDMCNVGPWPCPTVRAVQAALGEES